MIKEESILDEVTGEKFAAYAFRSRFKSLEGKFYAINHQVSNEFILKLKETTRFYRFPLPADLSELFIRFEESPLFFLYETPLIKNYENYLRRNNDKKLHGETHQVLIEYYVKWATLKSLNDKKFYANSALNIVTKNTGSENFLSRIIYGTILIFDQSFYNPELAREVLKRTEESVEQSGLELDVKFEFIYLLKIYTAFSYLAQKDAPNAFQIFTDAVQLKPAGITAQFYLALCSAQSNNMDECSNYIRNIFSFDVERLKFAIDSNSPPMFQYFLKYPVFSNLFAYDDFVMFVHVIEEIIDQHIKSDEFSIESLRKKLVFLSQLKINKFYNEEIIRSIHFLEAVIQKYAGNSLTLFNSILPKLHDRIRVIAHEIKDNISSVYSLEIQEKLSEFEQNVEVHKSNIEVIKKKFDDLRALSKQKLEDSISLIENNSAAYISQAEAEMMTLNNNAKLNPLMSFKNSMVYNIIASILVFLVAGIAGYSNTEYTQSSEINDLISGVIFQGVKWTLITFLLGSLISMAMAGFVFIDKSNHKHKLIQHISAIKNDKERQLNGLKERSLKSENLLQKDLKESLENENNMIDKYSHDLEELKQTLMAAANDKIAQEVKPLEPILNY